MKSKPSMNEEDGVATGTASLISVDANSRTSLESENYLFCYFGTNLEFCSEPQLKA